MALSRLESLPSEIKARIYRFLFISHEIHFHDPNPSSSFPCTGRPSRPDPLAILRGSKTIKADAEPHFYDVAIFRPCPCFLSRTETYDFLEKLSEKGRTALEPLLDLWELRRTTQVFNHIFKFFSGLQHFEFSYSDPAWTGNNVPWPGGEGISIAYLIAHSQRKRLDIWIRVPKMPEFPPKEGDWIWLKVGTDCQITILAESEVSGRRVKEYLLGLKHWVMLGEQDFPARSEFVLSNPKFEIVVVHALEVDWLYKYHYESCMEGRSASAKWFKKLT